MTVIKGPANFADADIEGGVPGFMTDASANRASVSEAAAPAAPCIARVFTG